MAATVNTGTSGAATSGWANYQRIAENQGELFIQWSALQSDPTYSVCQEDFCSFPNPDLMSNAAHTSNRTLYLERNPD
jgi:hypothetical protein